MEWFLYDRDLLHETVKSYLINSMEYVSIDGLSSDLI